MSDRLDAKAAARRQADLVSSLRRFSRPGGAAGNGGARVGGTINAANGGGQESGAANALEEHCDLCGNRIPPDHRHMLALVERQILCACESCLALRGGDADMRPTGTRTLWLDGFEVPDEIWASFGIPVGLAFFFHSSVAGQTVAMYPSPAGATECELDLDAWAALRLANPFLGSLEPDAEALIVNRMGEPHQHVIAPIDECYRLVGAVKVAWEGISGGDGPERAIADFFDELKERSG